MIDGQSPGADVALGDPASERGATGALLALGLVLCSLYVWAEIDRSGRAGMALDDGWIHLQFARQLAMGDGLAYNPGEWVSGSTAPLWTALLAIVHTLPGATVGWVKAIGVLLFLVSIWLTLQVARAIGLARPSRLVAGALVATSHWLIWGALSGMETPLATTLGLAGLLLHLAERRDPERPPASALVFAAAVLARPEAALLLVLALADRCVHVRKVENGGDPEFAPELVPRRVDLGRLVESVLLAATLLLPTLLFYRGIGGSWLPTTFAVKGDTSIALGWPDSRYLRVVADVFLRAQPVLLLAGVAGGLRLIASLGARRDRGLLLLAWPLALPLVYGYLTPEGGPPAVGNFGRYYAPLIPWVVVLGLYGVAPLVAALPRLRLGRIRLSVAALALVVLALPQLAALVGGPAFHAQTVADVERSDVAAARWLAPRLPADALLAVQDIGALKYHLPNRVLDLAGIVTPELLPAIHGGDGYWEDRLLAFLAERRPDYLVLFPRSYPKISQPLPGFTVLQTFEVPGNITMAGDRLVILATPWNRHPLR